MSPPHPICSTANTPEILFEWPAELKVANVLVHSVAVLQILNHKI